MHTLFHEQRAQLTKLVHDMPMRTHVEGPMNADYRALLFPTAEEEQIAIDRFFFPDNFYGTRDKTVEALEEAGMMVQTELDQLKENHGTKTGSPYHRVLRSIAKFSLTIVDGVSVIVVEQGVPSEAGGVANEIHPVLPVELCSMAPRAFSAALQKQGNRLLNKVSEQDIDDVDAQFRRFRIA